MKFFSQDRRHHESWVALRKHREEHLILSGTSGQPHKESRLLRPCLIILSKFIKLPVIRRISHQSTLNIKLTEVIFKFPKNILPDMFDNYQILHLSDLHLDIMPGLVAAIEKLDINLHADLVVFTGDFKDNTQIDYSSLQTSFSKLISLLKNKDGMLAVPGNHDSHLLPNFLSHFGIETLINESISISRSKKEIFITGVDDVYSFYSNEADRALSNPLSGFKILLVHSPNFINQASFHNYHLYLTGHTHGGQICLPGERPILTRGIPSKFIKGPWVYNNLSGYTSRGLGCSTVPLRLFSHGEITKLTLRAL